MRNASALASLLAATVLSDLKDASRLCLRNSGLSLLHFGVKLVDTGQITWSPGTVFTLHNACVDLASIEGISDGSVVIGVAKKALGGQVEFSQRIIYRVSSPNRANFYCQGFGKSFACSFAAPCAPAASGPARAAELYQCDRDCRWLFGFDDRSIVGQRAAWVGFASSKGNACCCYQGDVQLNHGGLIDRAFKKEFDTEDTWSGTETSGFDSPWACVSTDSGGVETMAKVAARAAGRTIIHCGKCAKCSALDAVSVLPNTRKWITYVMTKVSAKFAAPWGHKNVTLLERDLYDLAINFSVPLGLDDTSSSCMRCWSDNIMCDAMQCVSKCWTKFFDPTPTAECLACDERTCGPEFIKCAGANRRSTGIVSDISRPDRQQCKDGYFYGVADPSLPTLPKPSDKTIQEVCKQNAQDS